jgi:hypothetical protein
MKLSMTFILCFLTMSFMARAQKTVTGTVTDTNGEAVIGATVLIEGTTTGTATDFEGKYSINVPGDDAVLIFSYTGYKEVTVTVGARTTIDLVMETDVEILDEVVVSALGFEVKKDELGSTASVVQSDDVIRSGETGVINGLAGKAAGVQDHPCQRRPRRWIQHSDSRGQHH